MNYKQLLAFGMILLLGRCATPPVSDISTDPVDVGVPKALEPAAFVGTWRGIIPCADCPGIGYTLSLADDNSFEETMVYQERDVPPYTRSGTWRISDGKVELKGAEGGSPTRFELTQTGELNMLGQEGKPVITEVASMYVLRRDSVFVEDNPVLWDERRKRGLDFVATGNEPGWLLEVDLEKSMNFRTLPSESISIETPVPEPVKRGNSTTFSATTEAGELEVEIIEQPCEDTMSGKVSPYLVRVKARGVNFRGCGTYLQEN